MAFRLETDIDMDTDNDAGFFSHRFACDRHRQKFHTANFETSVTDLSVFAFLSASLSALVSIVQLKPTEKNVSVS